MEGAGAMKDIKILKLFAFYFLLLLSSVVSVLLVVISGWEGYKEILLRTLLFWLIFIVLPGSVLLWLDSLKEEQP